MKYYCGPDYAPEWVRRLLSFPLNDVCKCHDEDYENKSYSKIYIDLKFFFKSTLFSCYLLLSGIWGLILAPVFFIAVFLFGKRSWLRG